MRKKTTITAILLLTVFLSALLSGACGGETVTPAPDDYDENAGIGGEVTEDGNAVSLIGGGYKIVYPNNPRAAENYAAQELSAFIEQATGVAVPAVTDKGLAYNEASKYISVGNTSMFRSAVTFNTDALAKGGFLIQTVGLSVFIKGPDANGTLYGVYDFLEKIVGIRFLTDSYTYAPRLERLPLRELDIVEEPYFEQRYFYGGNESGSNSLNNAYMARSRQLGNSSLPESMGGMPSKSIDAGFAHTAVTHYVNFDTYKAEHFYSYSKFLADEGIGASRSAYERYCADYDRHNNWFWEYVNNGSPMGYYDLDYTNGLTDDGKWDRALGTEKGDTVFSTALASLKEYVTKADAQNKSINKFQFGISDLALYGCPGSRSKALAERYGAAGVHLRFVNALAEEIDKWARAELNRGDIEVMFFAYAYSVQAPVVKQNDVYAPIDDTVKARDNVRCWLAVIDTNKYYSIPDARQELYFQDIVEKWAAVCSKFSVWTYENNYTDFLVYIPTMQTWRDNFNLFKKINSYYVMMQSTWSGNGIWHTLMNSYVAAKMMWNPNRDVNKLKDEYITLYFGPAADKTRRAIKEYELHFAENAAHITKYLSTYGNDFSLESPVSFPTKFLERQIKLLDEAAADINASGLSAEEKAVFVKHVRAVKITPMFLLLYTYNVRYGNLSGRQEMAEEFFRYMDECGVNMLGETNGYKLGSVEDLRRQWL